MKRKTVVFTLCVALSILACVLLWRSHDAPTGDTVTAPHEEAADIRPANQDKFANFIFERYVWEAPDDPTGEPVELMPLFEEGDSLESVAERVRAIYLTMVKDYEKYLITKYAPLNLTEDEIVQRMIKVRSLEEMELQCFALVWLATANPRPWGLGYEGHGAPPETEEMRNFQKFRLTTVCHSTVFNEKDVTLSEEQREFLNGLIVTKKITSNDPGVLYNSSLPLSDEDKAFVYEAIKDNPDAKLPWNDPRWQRNIQ